MSEIVIPLVGGLGNQMFQYAAGRAVAERCNVPLRLDISWFNTNDDRDFALFPFKVTADIIEPSKTTQNFLKRMFKSIVHYFGFYSANHEFREKSFSYDPMINSLSSPLVLNGYFQSEKYFENIKDTISDEFKLKVEPEKKTLEVLELIESYDAVCIHIRRGDYVSDEKTNTYHGVCSMDYYHSGVAEAALGLVNPHCFVFSDDPEWVRTNFKLAFPMTIVDIHGPKEAHEDLRLMSACNHFVIANSSLSWWGAWLGTNKGKKVIAPKQWFADLSIDTSDLIPETWIRI